MMIPTLKPLCIDSHDCSIDGPLLMELTDEQVNRFMMMIPTLTSLCIDSHDCSIDGPLLMELTDEQMRKGLNILPLGHRETLKKKIQVGCRGAASCKA
eukprot:1161561-Pelagomonas_calceolata.AAC.11